MSLRRAVPAALCLALTGLLGWALSEMPAPERVAPLVEARLAESGVDNPVTAVLLNFRAYDTLLEISVLLLAATGAMLMPTEGSRAAGSRERPHYGPVESEMLRWYIRRLTPVVLVFGGYLWWTGSSQPGGAFQSGAVLAGGAALLLLSRTQPTPSGRGPLRPAIAIGLLAFLAAALVPLALGNAVLDYPEGWSKTFIVGIEAFAVISIAAGLMVLLAGAPAAEEEPGR